MWVFLPLSMVVCMFWGEGGHGQVQRAKVRHSVAGIQTSFKGVGDFTLEHGGLCVCVCGGGHGQVQRAGSEAQCGSDTIELQGGGCAAACWCAPGQGRVQTGRSEAHRDGRCVFGLHGRAAASWSVCKQTENCKQS
jgi:hypothetical protein